MKGVGEEGRMVQFSEVKWSELLPEGGGQIPYLLEKDVPVYFRVDPVCHLVYRRRHYAVPPVGETEKRRAEDFARANGGGMPDVSEATLLPVEGFLDCDLAFLRLDGSSLEQIHISRSCPTPRFTRGGLVTKPAYRVIGNDSRGRPIRVVDEPTGIRELVGVEFGEAVVVGKSDWNQAIRSGEQLARTDPLDYVLQGEVKREELFLDAVDIERLKREKTAIIERVAYPFRHEERMPGLYWMFQAAYALNELANLDGGKDGVGKWLMESAPEKTYRYKSVRTAEKFVWPKVDRKQGSEGRDDFDLENINHLHGVGSRSKYKLSFTSDGLAMILAIADYWHDLAEDEPKSIATGLAKTLMVNGFAGLEVGDLVYLISGKRVDLEIELDLRAWVAKQDEMARMAGREEMGWRDVIEQEERERLLKKRARDETGRERKERERRGAS